MQKTEALRRHYRSTPYWLIVRRGMGEIEALTVNPGGEEATLPIFSFEEEAAMYLQLANLGREWQIRQTKSEEFVSMFSFPAPASFVSCASTRLVALDPLPEPFSRGINLVSISVERFIDRLVEKAQPFAI